MIRTPNVFTFDCFTYITSHSTCQVILLSKDNKLLWRIKNTNKPIRFLRIKYENLLEREAKITKKLWIINQFYNNILDTIHDVKILYFKLTFNKNDDNI